MLHIPVTSLWHWFRDVGFSGSGVLIVTGSYGLWRKKGKARGKQVTAKAWQPENLVKGRWRGVFIENPSTSVPPVTYSVEWFLRYKEGRYRSRATATYRGLDYNSSQKYDIEGVLAGGRFLIMDYRNCNDRDNNFGHVIMKLSDDGSELTGCFVAHSTARERVISGTLRMVKS